MNRLKHILYSLVSLLFFLGVLNSSLFADDFYIVGGRSFAMGGAGVATNRGTKNAYWNPARLAFDRKLDFSISPINLNVDVMGTVVTLIDEFNKLPDFDQLQASYENGFDPKNPIHVDNARLAFKLLFEDIIDFRGDDGLLLHNNTFGGLHFNIKDNAFALTGGLSVTLGVAAFIDVDYGQLALSNSSNLRDELHEIFPNPEHTFNDISLSNRNAAQGIATQLQTSGVVQETTDLASLQEMLYQADQAGVDLNNPVVKDAIQKVITATQPNADGSPNTAKTLEDALKTSGFMAKGLMLETVTLSYARNLMENFSIGANLNLYRGRTYKKFITLDDMDDYDIPKNYNEFKKENLEDSMNIGLDLGLAYDPIDGLSLGLVGKNLNAPGFKYRTGGEYTLHPQVRFGVAYRKDFKVLSFQLAGDIDVLENKTDAFDDARFRQLALGAEVNLFKFLFVRAGYNNNLSATAGKGGMYTAGLGFYFFGVTIDASVGMGDDQIKIEDQRYPIRGGLAIELQWNRNF